MGRAAVSTIGQTRRLFEYEVRAAASDLDAAQRVALVRMLRGLRAIALSNAEESRRRNKWMMLAYWRVVAVYAGHFARLTKSVRPRPVAA